MIVPFAYLDQQYPDVEAYLDDIRALVKTGDFTLGEAVGRFETDFAAFCDLPHGIGVASGTDALMLSLRAAGVGPGDEVITASATFIATVGAIAMVGARPVFVDIDDTLCIDPTAIEAAITPRTKAIVPVHWTGTMADMPAISRIAERRGLRIVEDACHALGATSDGQSPGALGDAACFSFHPIKHINVWGDGGIVVTRSQDVADQIRLLRNHGLKNRDEAIQFGLNSRLQSLQALIAQRQLGTIAAAIDRRIELAAKYDAGLADLSPAVRIPRRVPGIRHSFAVYVALVERRDALVEHLRQRGVDAKVHYPLPVHLMDAGRNLGYGEGDFPRSEAYGRTTVTLPVHQFLSDEQVEYTIEQVRVFYC